MAKLCGPGFIFYRRLKGRKIMLADEACKNPREAWSLVSDFVGNFLLNVQLALSGKEDELKEIVSLVKKELVRSLSKLL